MENPMYVKLRETETQKLVTLDLRHLVGYEILDKSDDEYVKPSKSGYFCVALCLDIDEVEVAEMTFENMEELDKILYLMSYGIYDTEEHKNLKYHAARYRLPQLYPSD